MSLLWLNLDLLVAAILKYCSDSSLAFSGNIADGVVLKRTVCFGTIRSHRVVKTADTVE